MELNASQLRQAIDRGRFGDKAPGLDPAAAPLGADEEAGGARADAETLALNRPPEDRSWQENDRHPNAAAPEKTPEGGAGVEDKVTMVLAGGVGVAVLVGVVGWIIA